MSRVYVCRQLFSYVDLGLVVLDAFPRLVDVVFCLPWLHDLVGRCWGDNEICSRLGSNGE